MLTRRKFLGQLSTSAAILAAHDVLGQTQPATRPKFRIEDDPLIRRVDLLTATPLAKMREFYHDRMGFRILEENDREISFETGASELHFLLTNPKLGDGGRGNGEPMYHFAFNIPPDSLLAARAWHMKHAALVAPRADLRDPDYPDDVWHFRHWNAHSVFFFDPAYNIVEFIARHDLDCLAWGNKDFSVENIAYISEVGFVFDDEGSAKAARGLHDKFELNAYPHGSQPWWAMGDERGLLLCLARKGQTWGENTDTPVKWDEFPTYCMVRSDVFEGAHRIDQMYIVQAR
jgi:catechol 2,3-dioxygenase-like lactoylglutathione lyase family enzyme